jgi:phage terminase small subunit
VAGDLPALNAPREDWRHGLTLKQQRFVLEYLVDLNGTQAVIRAGYRAGSTHAARVIAAQTKRHPKVAAAIDRLIAEQGGITRTRILDELALIAFSNAGDYFEWGPDGVTIKDSKDLTPEQRAAVAEVSETVTEVGGTVRVKLHSKLEALEKLARATGLYTGQERAAEEQAAKARRIPLVNPVDLIRELLAAQARLGKPIDMGDLIALPAPKADGQKG